MLNTDYNTENIPLHEVLKLITDNNTCIVFKVIRGSDSDIEKVLSTGILNGNECYIRIQKAPDSIHAPVIDILEYGSKVNHMVGKTSYTAAVIKCATEDYRLSVIRPKTCKS